MTPIRQVKPKTCAFSKCGRTFTPTRPLQRTCPKVKCAIGYAREREEKKQRRARRLETRAAREALKTKPQLMSEAQFAVNAFVRERDRDRPCIDCGSFGGAERFGGQWDAGHFLSVGSAPELRFDETNIHKQLKGCNRPGGTTRAKFRAGLVARIGEAAVLRLEGPHEMPNWTRDDLRMIRDTYRKKLRDLRRDRAAKQAA